MTEAILCSTPKRASTVQRRVRSTESYTLVSSTKHTYNGICFFRANYCSRQITNIISVVERFGRKPFCSSGRIPARSHYSLRRRAMIFSIILPACATSEMTLQLVHSARSFFLEYHNDGIFPLQLCHLAPPPNTNDDIEQSPARGEIIVEGDLE